MLQGKSIAVLGAGKLGESLIRGLREAGALEAEQLRVTAGHPERVRALIERYGVRDGGGNAEAARASDVVLLSVKPQTMASLLAEIEPVLRPEQLLISVAASVGTPFLEKALGRPIPVVRAMPNTPSLIKRGMTGLCAGRHAGTDHLRLAESIFSAVGRTVIVDEKHMDAITGLSASGPAFLYIVIESLADAGVKVGLPREIATELAAQTVVGSGSMVLETGEHPARLKDTVTTPAGCTIDGILELEEGGLRVTLIKAVVKATQRARDLLEA